jgi:HlyD family secretion protein
MKRTYFVWAVVVLLAVGAAGWYGWTHRQGPALHLQTAKVTKGAIARRIVVAATLNTVKSVDVGSQVSGNIAMLAVDFNSIVKKGQLLAKLDPALFQAALDSSKAAYEQSQADLGVAQAALEDAQEKYTRAKALSASQLIAQSDMDAAEIALHSATADVTSSKASVTRMQANVEQAQTNLDHTIILAPTDGIIVNRSVDVGQTVAAAMTAPVLFRIAADLQKMQAQAEVDEADVGSVKAGETATFQVESYPNETFTGTISQVRLTPTTSANGSSTTNTNGQSFSTATNGITYTTIIDVANTDLRLRPGMTATVVLTGNQREDAIRIPNVALLFRPSLDLLKAVGEAAPANLKGPSTGSGDEDFEQVWQYDGKKFTPVPIRLGLSDAQWGEEISGPLKEGDLVVTNATFGPPPPAPVRR